MKRSLNPPQLRTPGVIAEETGQSLTRVYYILKTRRHIRPVAKAGGIRLYDEQAVEQVRQEAEKIDCRKTGKGTHDVVQ